MSYVALTYSSNDSDMIRLPGRSTSKAVLGKNDSAVTATNTDVVARSAIIRRWLLLPCRKQNRKCSLPHEASESPWSMSQNWQLPAFIQEKPDSLPINPFG